MIKPFPTITYYRLPQQTVQSIAAVRTVHYSGLYGSLWESVVGYCTKGLNH